MGDLIARLGRLKEWLDADDLDTSDLEEAIQVIRKMQEDDLVCAECGKEYQAGHECG